MPSVSKNQQKFMGMVHGLQKGEIDPKDVSQDVRDAAASMKNKSAKDFASTKHKGLPTKVENINEDLLTWISASSLGIMAVYAILNLYFVLLYKKTDVPNFLRWWDLKKLKLAWNEAKSNSIIKNAVNRLWNDDEMRQYIHDFGFSGNNRPTKEFMKSKLSPKEWVEIGKILKELDIDMKEQKNPVSKNMDEIFEQMFNESGLPDRMAPTDSFTELDDDLLDFNKERNERIKQEIVKRLKEENLLEFPQNWMDGRSVTNQHTAKKTAPRTYDNDEANFKVKYSGQPDLESDLEEHHEDYPDDILKSSVGDFLTKVKEKDEELYHGFEDILDKYIGSDVTESNSSDIKKLKDAIKIFQDKVDKQGDIKNARDVDHLKRLKDIYSKMNESVNVGNYDDERANFITKNSGQPDLDESNQIIGKDAVKYFIDTYNNPTYSHAKITNYDLDKVDSSYSKIRNLAKKKIKTDKANGTYKPITGSIPSKMKLESAMGEISLIAQEAPNFKKFLQDVFKEFKDLEKTKEAITWLKSVYDDRTNESVFDESIAININTLPDLIPSGEFKNRDLKQDIADALNHIYKKYGIGRTIKPR